MFRLSFFFRFSFLERVPSYELFFERVPCFTLNISYYFPTTLTILYLGLVQAL